jgi:hypothetical protein
MEDIRQRASTAALSRRSSLTRNEHRVR